MIRFVVIAFLLVILYNLGAGLFYMLTDRSGTDRTVNALTRRIGLSVGLIVLVMIGIATGVIEPNHTPH